MYGRHRKSIADIEDQLLTIFNENPQSHINAAGEPVIPADHLVDVITAFSDTYGLELMAPDELAMLKDLLESNPGLEVTPQVLVQFVAEKTRSTPPRSPGAPEDEALVESDKEQSSPERSGRRSRTSSNGSMNASFGPSRSRPPSQEPPQTPKSTVFDTHRQRSTPLTDHAPSSWSRRPAPASRRKSDAGSRSDSESVSASPSGYGRTPGRTRAPSNPTSPTDMHMSLGSPTFYRTPSRPHSRARSQPQGLFNSSYGFGSPGDDREPGSPELVEGHDDTIMQSINSLHMPHNAGSDSDSDEEHAPHLVMDRPIVSSTASLEPDERLHALQRANAELSRKLMEAETTLQNRLTEHEFEMDEMQSRLDEIRSELNATKREEKELRSKERSNSTQISALEQEVQKVTKALDQAKSTYQSLQRQYQEQISTADKYRLDLQERNDRIRTLTDQLQLNDAQVGHLQQQIHSSEAHITTLQAELDVAQQNHSLLDEQKQENLLLKETIDRMRYEMDEMRTAQAASAGGSAASSAANTISKSLGAELKGKLNWEMDDEQEAEEEDEEDGEETSVEFEGDEDTEGEDVIQTIITRKKRKVTNRANKIETRTFEEVKEYSDAYTQYNPECFLTSGTQTDPEPKILTATFSVQTEEPPQESFSVQTEPEPLPPVKITCDMDIQTDEPEPEVIEDPIPEEPIASSSSTSSTSTALPSTPKAALHDLDTTGDQPPAYTQLSEQAQAQRDFRVAAETLQKWHPGTSIPVAAAPAGEISEEALEEWRALKEELGVDCLVIDKLVEAAAQKTRNSASGSPREGNSSRRGRFYNIYNTYVYGGNGAPVTQTAAILGLSAVMYMLGAYMSQPTHYSLPGRISYYDRNMWDALNTMSPAGVGFGGDTTSAVWNILGRVGGGAARIARGMPT
ncbi:hypothetical protein HGRIS_004385 [Hohenbuehelia grisea]|uniref:Uncharacterized protein n=1 Tax=Hohenbuehelia grisea TaxID=104357 RepID=A0ABR3JBN8_9AGAR